MRIPRTLNTRLVMSHLLVSLVSIILMLVFAGNAIFQAATSEAQHSLQALAFAAGNALELPIEELKAGRVDEGVIFNLLTQMFSDSPDMYFTVFFPDGMPFVDSSETLPPRATRMNAPEVWQALESGTRSGVVVREDEHGNQVMYMAVLVQRDITVTGILRLGLPLAETRAAALNTLLVLLLFALLISAGVGIFGWVLARNLARPIQKMRRASESMEHGDLSVRVEPSGPYELHRLAESFNKMASRLETNVNELRAFVANASHELRTPLTVVKLRTEALQEGALEDTTIAHKFLGEIELEVDRLVAMINDLLDLSRMEAGMDATHPELIDMNVLAREVLESFYLRSEKAKITLTGQVEPDLPEVNGYKDQIRRVLVNYLDNALKYTPEGCKIDLIVRTGPAENSIRILVKDDGQGISSEHLSHVFERFYRAESTTSLTDKPRGSGLGLSIVKSIVESHGGEVGVSSQLENGTTFWADLPVAENTP